MVKHSLLTHVMSGGWIVLTLLPRPQLTRNTLGSNHKDNPTGAQCQDSQSSGYFIFLPTFNESE